MNKKPKLESSKESMFSHTWGCAGSSDGQFWSPHSVAVGCDGTIYITDSNNNRVQCFDSNGMFIHKWGQKGTKDGEFDYPTGLAIGVWNGMNASIMSTMMMVPSLASFPPGVLPICVSYIGIECLYCTELHGDRIQVFGMDGSFIRKWGSSGSGNGEFDGPWSCAIGPHDGMVYVSDTWNHRIQVFDGEGEFIRKWGSLGAGANEFNYPRGLSVSCDGLIYIADMYNHRVVCYHSDGRVAREWAPLSDLLGRPMNVMVDDDNALNGIGVVYVVDTGNNCIRQYRMDGTFLQIWGSKGKGDGELDHPRGMAKGMNIDGRPIIYIADTYNHRIVIINRF